jgi:hypothetical protein
VGGHGAIGCRAALCTSPSLPSLHLTSIGSPKQHSSDSVHRCATAARPCALPPPRAGHMDINRISGYIPGKIVFFLMQARVSL